MGKKQSSEEEAKDFLSTTEKWYGGWREYTSAEIAWSIESSYNSGIIRHLHVSQVVQKHEGGFLVKWSKRFMPLTDEEMMERYGRK